ncbi:TIGR02569 family protein [Actinoplanes sp. NPDC051411]|uniref:TIGR02569 family protein n=1 Tax=Actinoplanes sp. NPDC051411 TaxID=3155522 RepID=UPI00342F4E42
MITPPVKAFGAVGEPVRLAGGKGGTWRAGDLVLKPVEYLPETLWRAEVLDQLPEDPEFQVARPVRTLDGEWVSDGWEASRFLPGEPDVSRPDDVLRTGIAFHAALAQVARPAFLDVRDDPWSDGDRVAWEESPLEASPVARELLRPLLEARHPVGLPAQAVHGDLAGNVLFAPGRPPAVIDWPLYWRPPSWASAVAVADALCWYGAGPDLAERWSHQPEWPQMLIRALVYRIVTHDRTSGLAGHLDAYRPVIHAVLRRTRPGSSPPP